MRFESKRGPKREKEGKKMFCKLDSLFIFLLFFSIVLFLYISKMILKS
jgi:hypothetical protein